MLASTRIGWISTSELVPGDITCGLADTFDGEPQPGDLRMLCSVSIKGSGGLKTHCCYTLRLRTSNGIVEPCWYEPWYSRSNSYVISDAYA